MFNFYLNHLLYILFNYTFHYVHQLGTNLAALICDYAVTLTVVADLPIVSHSLEAIHTYSYNITNSTER